MEKIDQELIYLYTSRSFLSSCCWIWLTKNRHRNLYASAYLRFGGSEKRRDSGNLAGGKPRNLEHVQVGFRWLLEGLLCQQWTPINTVMKPVHSCCWIYLTETRSRSSSAFTDLRFGRSTSLLQKLTKKKTTPHSLRWWGTPH